MRRRAVSLLASEDNRIPLLDGSCGEVIQGGEAR